MVKALKQIFQLEGLPCILLHDNVKKLSAKVCLEASFTCLSPFVAFRVTFDDFGVERNVEAYCHAYI